MEGEPPLPAPGEPHLGLYLFARAVTTKYHKLGGLSNRKFSYCSVGWKSEIKIPAELVSSLASLLSFVEVCLLPVSSHGLPSVCVSQSPYKDTSHNGLGPTLMASF